MKTLCEKNFQGAWVVSAIIGGHRLHRIYMGYSKTYAIKHFKANPPK